MCPKIEPPVEVMEIGRLMSVSTWKAKKKALIDEKTSPRRSMMNELQNGRPSTVSRRVMKAPRKAEKARKSVIAMSPPLHSPFFPLTQLRPMVVAYLRHGRSHSTDDLYYDYPWKSVLPTDLDSAGAGCPSTKLCLSPGGFHQASHGRSCIGLGECITRVGAGSHLRWRRVRKSSITPESPLRPSIRHQGSRESRSTAFVTYRGQRSSSGTRSIRLQISARGLNYGGCCATEHFFAVGI